MSAETTTKFECDGCFKNVVLAQGTGLPPNWLMIEWYDKARLHVHACEKCKDKFYNLFHKYTADGRVSTKGDTKKK